MHVMTLDGGFRGLRGGGLGSISSEQQITLGQTFQVRLQPFFDTYAEVHRASLGGQLPSASAQQLASRYQVLEDRIGSHQEQLATLEGDNDVALWQRTADAIVQDANAFVRDARVRLGYERSTRGIQIAIAVGSSVTVLGGLAWIFYRASRRG